MANQRIAVIACGVLEWNIERLRQSHPDLNLQVIVLPAQLHNNPHRLRELVQERIDALNEQDDLRGIVIGYGVCGRGTIGLQARRIPLILPRVQDCIGAFLGSHSRHMEQFGKHPGTRYLTRGWYDKTVATQPRDDYHTARNEELYGTTFEDLKTRYGEDNARFICNFRDSWKRNYRRSAYIAFEGEKENTPGRQASRALADELEWDHEILAGDESLILAMLSGAWNDPRLLVVPPGNKTVSAPGEQVFGFSAGIDDHVEDIVSRYRRQKHRPAPERSGIGLGIDTGGTYTDAVIFDFSADRVLAEAKAVTTHDDLIIGIRNVLRKLPEADLARVERVGLSTTLATNAFVENKGRPVGLLLMSSFGVDHQELPYRFVRHVKGGMTIDGRETEGVDEDEVRRCAAEAKALGCQALAISGFGSVINPVHEQHVARIALEETGLHAVCGHELTSELNFMERATTAAMNAKLVPLIEALIDAVTDALAAYGLQDVRIMLVKGDGSQLLADVARAIPVETVLSGPAASVVGAAKLFSGTDAIVADMGGTTLDVALLRNGTPKLSARGARIAHFRTSVRAMEAQTIGLGGDSEIDLSDWPAVRIGPRRIIPICRLAETQPEYAAGFGEALQDAVSRCRQATDVVALAPNTDPAEDRLLGHLAAGPLLLSTLARRVNRPSPDYLPWHALESRGAIRRYGLTLTDILHVRGTFHAFDGHLSMRLVEHWCVLLEQERDEIVERILHEFRRLSIDTLLQIALPTDGPWSEEGRLRHWLTSRMAEKKQDDEVILRPDFRLPVIAVGAPAAALFPALEQHIGNKILVSKHAPVANALGAIAGDVMLRETATVRIRDDGAFVCSWRGGSHRAADLPEALQVCEDALQAILRRDAAANRIPFTEPRFELTTQEAETRDGPLFMGVTLQAEIKG